MAPRLTLRALGCRAERPGLTVVPIGVTFSPMRDRSLQLLGLLELALTRAGEGVVGR
jgi:hypothetical protein